MLLTITSNPAIDRTLHVPHLKVGAVHRTAQVHLAAGGKGLNVARAARTLGNRVMVTGPLAGHTGRMVADLAAAEGLLADWYWMELGETRTCLLLTHDLGDATVINETGPILSEAAWQGFVAHIQRLAQKAQAVAFSGSLPPGVAPGELGRLARSLVTTERAVYLDSSGAALAEALVQPTGLCIKVNREELAAGLGIEIQDKATCLKAGEELLARGAALVVVTLGHEGALAIAPEVGTSGPGCWYAGAPPIEVVSTVGSGDALLAGLAVARLRGQNLGAALALGVACGAANALGRQPGRFEKNMVEALLERIGVDIWK